MTKTSSSMVLGVSVFFIASLGVSSAESQPMPVDVGKQKCHVSAAGPDRTLIALRPGYGNHRTGNRYDNNRGGQWGNKTSGNKYSGNRSSSRPWTSKTTGSKYKNNRHKDGNDRSGNRQWHDHPH